jgi:hypothetical protein
LTSPNASGLPTNACDTDLARRCDCISDWPIAPTCRAPLSVRDTVQKPVMTNASNANPNRIDSSR